MTIEMKKVWFVDGQIIEQEILESDIYKRDWDIDSCKEYAKRIEDLEAMPKEVDVKHKTKYYALLKEYDRVCYLLDKATDKITDQDLMLAIQTARIVDLQTHIENFDGEDR